MSALLSGAITLSAQSARSGEAVQPAPAPAARVPTFANSTCPVMGKQVSMALFADTELGRIYVCCRPCIKIVLADVSAAYATAYGATKVVANARCPVSGAELGAEAVAIELQGRRFSLCCAACAPAARAGAQITLTRLDEPAIVDAGNATCPITYEPTVANAFAVVGGTIVHLSSPSCLAAVRQDPAAALAKARALASEQPGRPQHVHSRAASQSAPGAAGSR